MRRFSALNLRKFKKILLPFSIGLIVVLVPVIWFLAKNSQEAAAWFDDTWYYRTGITINNNGAADSNKKILFDIDTATLITAGKMQADCGDSRFTSINGELLRYYIDTAGGACNTSSTDYYVLVPTINAGATLIYHYYGNSNAENGTESAQLSQSTFSPTSTSTASEEKSQGPTLYWPFDDGRSTLVTDLSGNQNSGTLTSATTPITKIEQQINITDQEYSTTNTTDSPTDNSLGLILWDGAKYNGETVYFEAVIKCTTCTGGNTRASATLYTDAGSAVTGATVTSTSTSYALVRSSAITANLTNSEEYSVRIKVDATSGTAVIKAARLIVAQSDATAITDTQHQIELGNAETISATSYSELTDPKYYYYDASKFTGGTNAYFEASLKSDTMTSSQGDGRILSSGFELNTTTDGVEWELNLGSPTVQGTTARSGDYALQTTSFSSGTRKGVAASFSGASTGPFYFRTYFRYATLPSAENTIMFITDKIPLSVPVILGYITIDNSGLLRLYDEDGAIGSASSALSADTWYRIELEYDRTAAAGSHVLRARIDGTEFAGSATRNFSVSILGLALGGNMRQEAQTTGNWYFDDIAINNSTGSYPGAGKIIHLRPNATGDLSAWTNDYTAIDEVTPNDITDYISSAALQSEYVNIDNTPAGLGSNDTINNVAVGVRARSNDGSANARFKVGIKDTTEGTEENPTQLTNNTSTWYTNKQNNPKVYNQFLYDLPNASTTSWTKATLDTAQIGVTQTVAVGGTEVQVSTLWMVVDYTPAEDFAITARAKLQQCDENSCSWGDISGSAVTSTSTSFARVRSSALTLTDNRRYRVVVEKSDSSGTVKIANAKLIIDQSDTEGIGDIELVHQHINTLATDTDSTYTSQTFLNTYTPDNFDPDPTVYYEGTLKTSAGTGYAQAYNNTAAAAISSSEVTTTSTSYTRVRSTSLTMPASAAELDTQIKNSASNTTSVSSSWFVIQISGQSSGTLPTWQNSELCAKGSCLYFNGDSVIRTFSSDSELNPGTNSFTVSSWFKHSSTLNDTDTIITRYSAGGYKIYSTSIGFCFGIDSDGTSFPSDSACSSNTYADSTWHHFAAVKSGTSNISLYIDGVRVGQDTSITGSSISGSSPLFQVGAESLTGSNSWDGFIDDVKYYNYALSEAQIKANYNAPGSKVGALASFVENPLVLSNDLVGLWNLDDNTGTSAADSSGNASSGTFYEGTTASSNGPTWSNGKFGSGANIPGSNDVIRIAENTGTDLGATTDSYTVSLWINTTQDFSATATAVAKATGSTYPFKIDITSLEFPRFRISDGTHGPVVTGASTINDGNWHLLTGVRDATNRMVSFYVDGALVGSTEDTVTSSTANNDNISIGADGSSYNANDYTGKVDELRIYRRALTTNEVAALYNLTPGPVAHWKLDEGTGTITYDATINENTSDTPFTGNTTWITGKYGSAAYFDGTNDGISFNETTYTDLGTTSDSVTVSAWIKTTTNSANTAVAIAKYAGGSNSRPFLLGLNSSEQAVWEFSNVTNITSTNDDSAINDGNWHHLVGVRDVATDTAYLYVDGILVDSDADTVEGSMTNDADVSLGLVTADSSLDFEGSIDDVRIYNYARNTNQIVSDMNAGHPVGGSPVASQVAYYTFDEQQGSTTYNSNSTFSTLTGTSSGATWKQSVDCKQNGCLDFDGSDDVVTVTLANPIDFDKGLNTGATFSAWIRPETVGEGSAGEIFRKSSTTFCKLGGTTPFNISCSLDLSTDATLTVNGMAPATTWTHIAMTWTNDEDDEITIWVNGQPVGTSTNGVGGPTADASNLLIGGGTSNNFDGRIDEFKVYSSELTLEQIKIDYNLGAETRMGTADYGQNISGGAGNPAVAYWNFNEKTGTSANDTSGTGITGTLGADGAGTDLPYWTAGKYGAGLGFDGTDDFIQMADNSNLSSANKTLEFWINKSNSTDRYVLAKATTSKWEYGITVSSVVQATTYQCAGSNHAQVTGSIAINDGEWHHVAVVQSDSSYLRIYIDGVQDTQSTSFTGTQCDSDDVFYIGRRSDGFFITALLDDVKVYNYARSDAQVAFDYNKGAPIAHWKFDECQGTTAYDFAPNSNGGFNGNNATININATGNTAAGTCNSGVSTHAWNNGTTGKFNSAIDLDGSSDYVYTAEDSSFGGKSLSMAMWIKPATLPENANLITREKATGTKNFKTILQSTGLIAFHTYSSCGSAITTLNTAEGIISTGQWYHVVFTLEHNVSKKIYVNGTLIAQSSADAAIPTGCAVQQTVIGASQREPTVAFDGLMDDVRIYRYALSENQIKQIMNNASVVRFD